MGRNTIENGQLSITSEWQHHHAHSGVGQIGSGALPFEAAGGDPDFDANLNGSWTRTGSTVELDHSADTFLRDTPLTFDGGTLTGDETLGGVRVQVTLTRVGIAE